MAYVTLGGAEEVYILVEFGEDLDFAFVWKDEDGTLVNAGDLSSYTASFIVTDPSDDSVLFTLTDADSEITLDASTAAVTLVAAASEYTSATKDKEYNCRWVLTDPSAVPRIPAKGKIKFRKVV